MANWLKRSILLVSVGFAIYVEPAVAEQPQSGILKTKDGRSFVYDSVQINGTTYLVKPHGLTPIEIPIADVLCLNQACDALPARASGLPASPTGTVSIAGSNTIGASLMPALLRKWAESYKDGKVDAKFGQLDEQALMISRPGSLPLEIELAAHGSETGFQRLLAGTALIGMASRSVKPDEVSAFRRKLDVNLLAPDSEHVIGLDGLAVMVNKANPLKNFGFSTETLAKIFSGEISDWSQIGGKAGTIVINARDDNSGTFSTFKDLVLKPSGKSLSPSAKRFESSDELSEAVAKDDNAIGFAGLPYVRDNEAVAIGSSCGITQKPTRFTVQSEVYPLTRRLYLYTPGAPRNEAVKAIVDFATSDAAQAVVREQGFIDQSIEFEDPQLKTNWLEDLKKQNDPRVPTKTYAAMIQLAEATRRGSVDFRFNTGSADLDNKAVHDVARLARVLSGPDMNGKAWYLVGFADTAGTYAANSDLSVLRAQAVARVLRKIGAKISNEMVLGFGWLAPVACNDTEVGRLLNRRVEIWVAR